MHVAINLLDHKIILRSAIDLPLEVPWRFFLRHPVSILCYIAAFRLAIGLARSETTYIDIVKARLPGDDDILIVHYINIVFLPTKSIDYGSNR